MADDPGTESTQSTHSEESALSPQERLARLHTYARLLSEHARILLRRAAVAAKHAGAETGESWRLLDQARQVREEARGVRRLAHGLETPQTRDRRVSGSPGETEDAVPGEEEAASRGRADHLAGQAQRLREVGALLERRSDRLEDEAAAAHVRADRMQTQADALRVQADTLRAEPELG